jgi:hypothetical protein
MPKTKIRLVGNGTSGAWTEEGTDATWVRDQYTEPRETLFDCAACEEPIKDWYLYTCLDGGDAAHLDCVELVTP